MSRFLNIAMLSVHSSPLGRLGASDTGGMSVYVLELASELGRKGHHVDIFTRQTAPEGDEVYDYAPNVRIIAFAVAGTENLQRTELFVHLHRYASAIESFRNRSGVVYDLLHSNYWLSGVVGEQIKMVWCCPHLITFHTLAAAKMAALHGHKEHQKRVLGEARLLRTCNGVIVPTVEEAEYCASILDGKGSTVHQIPWGVNTDRFTTAAHEGSTVNIDGLESEPLLLIVGRFDPMKGIDLGLRSFSRLVHAPEVHLALVGGDGPGSSSYQRITRMVNDFGLGTKVHLLGRVEHEQMVQYYQRADVVAVPSRYESFGLVILEALASGTPVAATSVGVAPHVIQQGENGYLAAPGNEDSMVQAISKSLMLARRQGAEQIRRSVREFSWARVANSVEEVYNNLILYT